MKRKNKSTFIQYASLFDDDQDTSKEKKKMTDDEHDNTKQISSV